MANVADDAHHFAPLRFATTPNAHALSDRIFVRPECARHGFIDDHNSRSAAAVALFDAAPAKQSHSQCLEVIGRNCAKVGGAAGFRFGFRAAFYFETLRVTGAGQRELIYYARGLNAGESPQSLKRLIAECGALLRLRIAMNT